jgi:hypothetical protein
MSVLLSLTVAVPLVCLAFLSLLGFVGIMALAGVMHVIVTAKAAFLGTGARSLARCQSLPGGSHNPPAFAGPDMLAADNQTQRSSDDRETHHYECTRNRRLDEIRREACDYFKPAVNHGDNPVHRV